MKSMSNKSNSKKSLTTAPLNIFADQPAAIQVGPYVTKITLGVIDEEDDEFPRPVVTIAMPTVNLIRMIKDLNLIFSDSNFKKESAESLTADIKEYFAIPKIPDKEATSNIKKRTLKSTPQP
jgi:hypothetical protein